VTSLWLGAIVLVLATLEARLTARQVASWQDSHALWARAVAAQPEAFLAHLKYAEVLETEQGWREALAEIRTVARRTSSSQQKSTPRAVTSAATRWC
jgi:hypothetical protein